MWTEFDPVVYNRAENEFLKENIGLAPIVALSKSLSKDIVVSHVQKALAGVYELVEMEKHDKTFEWAGVEAVKGCISTFLSQTAEWERKWTMHYPKNDKYPRHPSMYTFSGKNQAFYQGPGSDVGSIKTYYDANGNRKRFLLELIPSIVVDEGFDHLSAPVKSAPKDLLEDVEAHRFECRVCRHTESFKEGSRSSWVAARARMSKHLKGATEETDLHREYYLNVFGS